MCSYSFLSISAITVDGVQGNLRYPAPMSGGLGITPQRLKGGHMEEDKTKQKHKIKRNEERIKNGKEHIEDVRRRMEEQFGPGVMGKAYQMKDVLTKKGMADCKVKQPRFGHRLIPYELLVGSMIPNGIMRYRGFKNESCKLLWGRLAQYAGKDGVVDPGMRTLAKEIGVSIGTVKKCLTELEDKGFIVKQCPRERSYSNIPPRATSSCGIPSCSRRPGANTPPPTHASRR